VIVLAVGGLAFGAIRGEQQGWTEPVVLASLATGALAALSLPFLMLKRRDPLVPPSMFESRNFTVTNLSTLVIYGALYVTLTFQGIFLIEVLGYNEQAAGLAGLPATLLLVLFSTRFGALAARFGPRRFMAIGPAVMGIGLLWLTRIPSTSARWLLGTGEGSSLVPPADYWIDIFPALIVFGAGLTCMVAPLTTALMTSVPSHKAGVASAINNAISRVGSPLINAVIFVAVASSFYGAIAERVPDADVDAASFRREVAPLNEPGEGVSSEIREASGEASTDAFHLAVIVSSSLLFLGAAINAIGIRDPKHGGPDTEVSEPTGAASAA
jgi:predicted MFS family arabinose efflux permease